MPIKKVTLVLNTDDPEQMELYTYVTKLPNGKKRNASAFLRTMVDREYRLKRESYLAEGRKKVIQNINLKPDSGSVKFILD
jgi:hypothetical protein